MSGKFNQHDLGRREGKATSEVPRGEFALQKLLMTTLPLLLRSMRRRSWLWGPRLLSILASSGGWRGVEYVGGLLIR